MQGLVKSLLVALLMIATCGGVQADTRTDVGMSFGSEGLRSFYLAIGEYYRVPERQIAIIRDRRIPDYDVPVVLFIADRARVAPEIVMDYRMRGMSWMDISLHFGLPADIYYVPVTRSYGPPYGHAYGHYKNKHNRNIRLDDDDVVNMVNLRFMSERYGYAPDEVIRMRSSGKNFVRINEEFRARKDKRSGKNAKDGDKRERKEMKQQQKEEKHQGKGNGKGRDND